MNESHGILYQLTDSPGAELLATSLWSLRQHYDGPVAIATTPQCLEIAKRFSDEPRIDAQLVEMLEVPGVQRLAHFNKVVTYLLSPFERTVYLDADTVIQGSFSPLFRSRHGIALTQVANMWLRGGEEFPTFTRKRMQVFRKYSQVLSSQVDACIAADPPLVNCGLVLFERDQPFLQRVHDVGLIARTERMNDEIVMTLLMPSYLRAIHILCDKWNRCVRYALDKEISQSVMLHFHNRTWYRGRPHRDLWCRARDAAISANFAGLADWCGQYHEQSLDGAAA